MITKLFPEILAYIMILTQGSPFSSIIDTTPEDDDDDPESNSNHGKPPQPFEITISHVNSRLREIALCTPHLWSSIHIDTGMQSAHLTLQRTKAYVDRSGGYFLDLRIEVNESKCDYEERWMLRQALELVAGESRRWRRLTIISEREEVAGMDIITSKLSQAEGDESLSNLEHLSISNDYSSDVGDENEEARCRPLQIVVDYNENSTDSSPKFRKTLLKCLPKLSFLRLRGLALYTFQLVFLPALRILHLDQTKAIPMTSDLLESVAVACPALEHLSVYGDIIKSPSSEGGAVRNVGLGMPFPSRVDNYTPRGVMFGNIGSSRGRAVGLSAKSSQGGISLPQLRSLRVCGTQGLVYKTLLSRLEAPRLRNLMLKDAHEHDLDTLWEASLTHPQIPTIAGPSEAHTPMSTQKFIQIQSLAISNSNLSKFVYQGLFRVFPSLTEFSSYSSMDPDTASKFLDDGVEDVPWLNLRMLTFIFDVDLTAEDKSMAELLQKRKGVGFPIQKVRIGVAEIGVDYGQVQKPVAQETAIVVEKSENFDVWPFDRLYPDIDDTLF